VVAGTLMSVSSPGAKGDCADRRRTEDIDEPRQNQDPLFPEAQCGTPDHDGRASISFSWAVGQRSRENA